jgi:TFIIF-interacting CTD phosphatase-like protein
MAEFYEIVIFTQNLSNYAEWILNKIDEKNKIKHKLFKEHF